MAYTPLQSFFPACIQWPLRMVWVALCLLGCLGLVGTVWASDAMQQTSTVGHVSVQERDSILLGERLQYYEDPLASLDLDNLLGVDTVTWLPVQRPVANFGYSSSAFWFRVTLTDLDVEEDHLLEISYALLDQVDVWFVENGQVVSRYKTGDHESFSNRKIQHRYFLFPVPHSNSGSIELWMRVETNGTLEVPATLWRADAFHQKEQHVLILKGIYYGIIIVMILYNGFIYLSVRELAYLYYVCYALSLLMFQLSIDGFAFQWLWPDFASFNEVSFIIFIAFIIVFICLFSNTFLHLPQYFPRLSQVMLGAALLGVLTAVAALIIPYSQAIKVVVAWGAVVCVLCLSVGSYLFIKQANIARYYLSAWFFFMVGSIAFAFNKYGLLPSNLITSNAMQIGSSFEVVLFSLALADRINRDKREKLMAKQEAIKNLEKFKSLYENAIEGIFQCTLDGKFLSANPSMAHFMGYATAEDFMYWVSQKSDHEFLNPVHYHEFRRSVLLKGQVLNYEAQGHRRDGTPFWCSLSAKLVKTRSLEYIEGFVVDITARKKSEEQLHFLARHDPLTGLVNRREFEIRLQRALFSAHRDHTEHALLYMDLDQFKLVNDTCGHIAGDELLRQVTWQLQQQMRGGDTLARLGGDEFGVLLERCSGHHTMQVANKLKSVIQDFRFVWEDKFFTLGVSIGLVPITETSQSVSEVLSLADAACYAAKESGRNRVHEYRPGDQNLVMAQNEMQWASRINEALEHGLFVLYKQAIVPVDNKGAGDSSPKHFEILVRMRSSNNEILPPGSFLPAAERYNLMPAVDRWVIRNLFAYLSVHPEKQTANHMYAINLSGLSLGDDDFEDFVFSQFEAYHIRPQLICFEITETIAVTNLTKTIGFIDKFKAIGCRFSLDDFGSGFSSYGYLKNLPVDYLKIDGLFVVDIVQDEIDYAMVESINRIGHVMGKKTIAEFVENDQIRARLKELGVDYAQGYGIAMPEPLS